MLPDVTDSKCQGEKKLFPNLHSFLAFSPPQNFTDVNGRLSTSDPISQNTARRNGAVAATFYLGDQGLEREGYEKYRLKFLFRFSGF